MGHLVGLGKVYANPRTPAQQRASNAGAARQDATFAEYFHGAVVKFAVLTTNVTAGAVVGADIVPGTGTAAIYELYQADDDTDPIYKLMVTGPVLNPYYSGGFTSGWIVPVVYTGRFFVIITDPAHHG